MINKVSSLLEDEPLNLMSLSLSLQEKLEVLIDELVDEASLMKSSSQMVSRNIMVRVDSCGRRASPPAPPSPGSGALANAGKNGCPSIKPLADRRPDSLYNILGLLQGYHPREPLPTRN